MAGATAESDGRKPSPQNFQVSMSNVLLGKNPVVVRTSEIADSEPTSGETSDVSESEPQVILIPLGDADTDTESSASEHEKKRQKSKGKDSDKENIVCEKTKMKAKAKANAEEKGRCQKAGDRHSGSESDGETSSDDQRGSRALKKGKKHTKESGTADRSADSDTTSKDTSTAGSDATTTDTGTGEASSKAASGDGASGGNSHENKKTREDAGLSMSEDTLIRSMKTGGESWAEMAKALNRSKGEVKSRWKVIEHDVVADDSDDEEKNGKVPKAKDEGKKKQGEAKDPQSKKSKGDSKSTSTDNQAKKKVEQQRSAANASPSDSSLDSSVSAASEVSDEHQSQQSYLHKHITSALYPPRIHPKPEGGLSQTDCEVLAAIDARRHHGRWLEMQANFYNVTGRMVPLSVIRERCERAERERLQELLEEEGERDGDLLERVERWVSGVGV